MVRTLSRRGGRPGYSWRGMAGYAARRYGPYLAQKAGAYAKSKFSRKGGNTPSTGTSKRSVVDNGDVGSTRTSRTLYNDGIVEIPKNLVASDNIDTRQRELCYVSGVKICYEFCNQSTNVADVQLLNFALVKPRCSQTTISNTDFFRSSTTQRGRDFDQSLSSLEFDCLPINSDEYQVFWRKKYRILPQVADSNGRWRLKIEKFIKLKRQYRFKDGSETPVCGAPRIVYWIDKVCTDGGTTAALGALSLTKRSVVYFREPK